MVGTCDTDERWPHPKELLYGELATGKIPTGQSQLRFKDVRKRDLQALGINTDSLKVAATDRDDWKHTAKKASKKANDTL